MSASLNLANFLTLLRLLLAPLVVMAIISGRAFTALALFALAAVTDVLDGAAARHLGLTTSTGAYLDPVADKLLLSSVFLALAAAQNVPWWLVAVVLGRDIFILLSVGAFFLWTSIRKFPPSVWGKLSTFVQILTVVVWMGRNWLQTSFLNALAPAMIWICAACTIWSGLDYTWRGIRLLRAD